MMKLHTYKFNILMQAFILGENDLFSHLFLKSDSKVDEYWSYEGITLHKILNYNFLK